MTETIDKSKVSISRVQGLQTELDSKQEKTNLVTSISSSSTDIQYPSAKCIYDIVGDIETALHTINSGS